MAEAEWAALCRLAVNAEAADRCDLAAERAAALIVGLEARCGARLLVAAVWGTERSWELERHLARRLREPPERGGKAESFGVPAPRTAAQPGHSRGEASMEAETMEPVEGRAQPVESVELCANGAEGLRPVRTRDRIRALVEAGRIDLEGFLSGERVAELGREAGVGPSRAAQIIRDLRRECGIVVGRFNPGLNGGCGLATPPPARPRAARPRAARPRAPRPPLSAPAPPAPEEGESPGERVVLLRYGMEALPRERALAMRLAMGDYGWAIPADGLSADRRAVVFALAAELARWLARPAG
jgi:hypothetical protein